MPMFKKASRSINRIDEAKKELDHKFAELVRPDNGDKKYHAAKAMKLLKEQEFEIAQTIIQMIDEQLTITDPLPFFAEQVTGDIRDNYVWQELDATVRVVDRAYGTKPLSQRLTFREYSMSTSMKEVAVEIPLEEVAVGRVTASQVTDAIAAAITRDRISSFLNALNTAITSGTDNTEQSGYNRRYSGFTQANLDKAIDGLLDDSESPVLFARHVSVAPVIRSFSGWTDGKSGWSPDSLLEFERRGFIGTYHGCEIFTLRDQYAPLYARQEGAGHLIKADKWWLAGGRKGARYMAKDVSFLNWSVVDPRTSTFGVGIRLEEGLMVYNQNRYRVLVGP